MSTRPSPLSTRLTILLLAPPLLLASLNFSVMYVAFGEIEETFSAHATIVSWTLTAFSITVAAVMIPAGWLADRIGRPQVLIMGFGLFLLGSALISISPWIEALIVARIVQAAGLASISPSALAIILTAFGPERRSTAVGLVGGLGGAAAAVGPVIGGNLVESVGWRWTFAANLPIGIIFLIAIIRYLPRGTPNHSSRPPDAIGIALLVVGIASLALAIVQSDDWGFLAVPTLVAFLLGAVTITAMVQRSRTHPEPIVFLPLFRNRSFAVGSSLSLVLAGTFGGMYLAMVTLLTDGWSMSLREAGLALGLIPLIGGPLAVVAGRISDIVGHRLMIIPGALCIAAGSAWMLLAMDETRNIAGLWIPAIGLYSIGVGLSHSTCAAAALSQVAVHRLGVGGAMNRISQEIGVTISVAVVIAFAARSGDDVLAATRAVLIYVIVASLLSVAIATRLPARRIILQEETVTTSP